MNLFPYQKQAIDFIRDRKKVYLAMEMGTGKTLTSIAAAVELAKKNVLVIAEKNEIVNSENFKKEVEAHFPEWGYTSLRNNEIMSLPMARFGYKDGDKRFVCGINPDGLKKHPLDWIYKLFDFVIIDEATMAKTTTTDRFKTIYKVCKESEYLVLLSGTPMMNGAAELYAPLILLDHALAGDKTAKSREAFEAIFAGGHRRKIRNTGVWYQDYAWWAKGANNVKELRQLVSDRFFFIRKDETGVFRKKVRTVEYVPMSFEWIAEYAKAWDDYYDRCVEQNKRTIDPDDMKNLDNISELQSLIEMGQMYQVNSKWKARRVAEDIAGGKYGDRRLVVFSLYIETEEILKAELTRLGVAFRTFEDIKEWKQGDEPVLLGRIKAHGKGGNVAEASAALFIDMDFVPANNIQAENRIDRPEQKRDMLVVYYMTAGDDVIDAHVRRINQDKTRKIVKFMEALTPEEIAEMPKSIAELKVKYRKQFNQLGV